MKNIPRPLLVAGAFAVSGLLASCAHQSKTASSDAVQPIDLAPTMADHEREQRENDRVYQDRVLKELSTYKPKT